MTLYRIDLEAAGTHDAPFAKGLPGALPFLIEDGVLVEVEPCVHGNYARHMVDRWFRNDTGYNEEWCSGVGIGDTE